MTVKLLFGQTKCIVGKRRKLMCFKIMISLCIFLTNQPPDLFVNAIVGIIVSYPLSRPIQKWTF